MDEILRSYTSLLNFSTFEERFRYLALRGAVGDPTFGYERGLNQRFYASYEWKEVRQFVIARDESRDLGIEGYEIYGRVYIHHLNPITPEQIYGGASCLVDPENLISVTHVTHNAIHYGDERQLPRLLTERTPGDTASW